MALRFLAFLPVLICALWPQGVVLCTAADGHRGFEPGCAPVCPAGDEGPDHCDDVAPPDLRVPPAAATAEAPGPSGFLAFRGPPVPEMAVRRGPARFPSGLPPEFLRSTVLVV